MKSWVGRVSVFFVFLLGGSVLWSSAWANYSMSFRGEDHHYYARMLFQLEGRPKGFYTMLRGNLLSVKFEESIDVADSLVLPESLLSHVEHVKQTPDGHQFIFTLRSPHYRVRQFVGEGGVIGIDLIRTRRVLGIQSFYTPIPDVVVAPAVASASVSVGVSITEEGSQNVSDEVKPEGKVDAIRSVFANPPVPMRRPARVERIRHYHTVDRTDPDGLAVRLQKDGSRNTLLFPWQKDVAAAVFARGEFLWVVFDEDSPVRYQLSDEDKEVARPLEEVQSRHSTILRFYVPKLERVFALKKGSAWHVSFGGELSNVQRLLEEERDVFVPDYSTYQPNALLVSLQEDARAIKLYDPVVGDELVVVPTERGAMLRQLHRYVDYDLLQTAQGVALVIRSDGVQFKKYRSTQQLEVVGPSEHMDILHQRFIQIVKENTTPEDEPEIVVAQPKSLLNFERWLQVDDDSDFAESKQHLRHTIALASDAEKNLYRLELAQFYFAHGMAREALAVIDVIKKNIPDLRQTLDLQFLEGVSYYMDGRYDEALAVLRSVDLAFVSDPQASSEVRFWREAAKVRLEYAADLQYLPYQQSFLSLYPRWLREDMALLTVDALLGQEKVEVAKRTLDTVKLDIETARDRRNYYYYLQGILAAKESDYEVAQTLWKKVVKDGMDRHNRAKASFALTRLRYYQKEIDLAEATKEFDRVRVMWRGDRLERRLLKLMGQLFAEHGRYREALTAWREVLVYYPKTSDGLQIANLMNRTFVALFNESGADTMPAVEALGLYYDFRELTPIGVAGDEMIQKLSDRLIEVDLLDDAAALLTHQVKYRLEGEEKGRIGTKLALVHLMARNPELVFEAIDVTEPYVVSKELKLYRHMLAVQARIQQKKYDEALAMLEGVDTEDALLTRVDIHFRKKDWRNIILTAQSFFDLAVEYERKKPFNLRESDMLVRLALAHAFEGNHRALDQLYDNFNEMVFWDGKHEKILEFLQKGTAPVDPFVLDETLYVDDMQRFLDRYRVRIVQSNS